MSILADFDDNRKSHRSTVQRPDPWIKLGIRESDYEELREMRVSRKRSEIRQVAERAMSLAVKRQDQLKVEAKQFPARIPRIAEIILSLRENSLQLSWELKLALEAQGEDNQPWHTVDFLARVIIVQANMPTTPETKAPKPQERVILDGPQHILFTQHEPRPINLRAPINGPKTVRPVAPLSDSKYTPKTDKELLAMIGSNFNPKGKRR